MAAPPVGPSSSLTLRSKPIIELHSNMASRPVMVAWFVFFMMPSTQRLAALAFSGVTKASPSSNERSTISTDCSTAAWCAGDTLLR